MRAFAAADGLEGGSLGRTEDQVTSFSQDTTDLQATGLNDREALVSVGRSALGICQASEGRISRGVGRLRYMAVDLRLAHLGRIPDTLGVGSGFSNGRKSRDAEVRVCKVKEVD